MIRELRFCIRRQILIVLFLSAVLVPYTSAQETILQIDTDASCITSDCHRNMGKKKYVHAIGVDGKLCTKCHRITEKGQHRFEKISTVTGPLCAQCHSKNIETPPYVKGSPPKVISKYKELKSHKPFAEGKCTECHDAHESNYYKQLKEDYPEDFYVYFSRESYALCFNNKCHGDIERAFTEPRTLTETLFRNGNLNLHYRHVNKVKGRHCSVCHYPHSSVDPKLIRNSFPFGKRKLTIVYEKTETGGGCITTCHKRARYDRYDPVNNNMRVSPRLGKDAPVELLQSNKEQDIEAQEEKNILKN